MWNRAVSSVLIRERAQKLCGAVGVRAYSTEPQAMNLESIRPPVSRRTANEQRISRAMRVYLERAQKQDKFLHEKREEFELAKRHLANIMGWDRDEITQENIDEAIAYLLPSGLFEPRARPMMKPPEVIYATEKMAEFDDTGRPFNYLFYTTKGNFYTFLHDAYSELNKLNELQAKMRLKGVRVPEDSEKADLHGYKWISKEQLANLCLEKIKDENYEYFLQTMQRLVDHPYSNSSREFLQKFLVQQIAAINEQVVLPLMHDKNGNPYMDARARRKTARAKVRVTGNGTGQVIINRSIEADEYFSELKDRIQIMLPLQFVGLLNKVDIDATIFYQKDEYERAEMAHFTEEELKDVTKPLSIRCGSTCEAGALRLAIAKALCSFVTADEIKLMRLAGLLSPDIRNRERKKPGQEGARRKYPWRKR